MRVPNQQPARTLKNLFTIAWISTVFIFTQCSSPNNEKETMPGETTGQPNFVIIFTDDQGYGDLGIYGHPTIKTPNLDRMAMEGQKWTNFYVSANVCTPSRAGLLTGRYAIRSGMTSEKNWVLFPDSKGGLPDDEITIAEMLKGNNYTTGAIGKWHLGHLPQYLPTQNGFDSYFGIPYSNDMDRVELPEGVPNAFADPKTEYFQVPLMRDDSIVERPADQNTLVKRYTEEAVKFIAANKDKHFFLYLAHNLPHVPLFASPSFKGSSERGLYGDVIEEIDWSTGEILKTLKDAGIDDRTLVVFTSDNGPWKLFGAHGGSSGLLYGAKGTSYEGGVREPAIFWWPGTIAPAVISKMGCTLDLLPTFANLANAALPSSRVLDGFDLTPVLKGSDVTPRDALIYYHNTTIFAARKGDYKLYFYSNNPEGYPAKVEKLETYQLFNLSVDPSEQYDVVAQHPEIVNDILEMVEKHKAGVVRVKSQLDDRTGQPTLRH